MLSTGSEFPSVCRPLPQRKRNGVWITAVTGAPHMAWVFLGIAGIFEIAFALGMKASAGFTKPMPALLTVGTGLSSVYLLSLALRTLPVGSAYAVWTGIGAAGTAILGVAVMGETAAPIRMFYIVLILAGVIGLKLAEGS